MIYWFKLPVLLVRQTNKVVLNYIYYWFELHTIAFGYQKKRQKNRPFRNKRGDCSYFKTNCFITLQALLAVP